jgi:hypothetical protein
MDQLSDYADDRLINGCIYCGGYAETRDHVPSRILLDPPYPENLPVVGACQECNQGFSKDEQYLVCLLESVIAGSTDPDKIKRPSVARALKRSPALRSRIESGKKLVNDRIVFDVEEERIKNVMFKLARGHAAFELSQPCREEPDHFWCGPLESLPEDESEYFFVAHVQQLYGEIGSRNMQRMYVTEVRLRSESGEEAVFPVLVNDWIEVQAGCYRYLAIDDVGGVVIRIVISEYLACEVKWDTGGEPK